MATCRGNSEEGSPPVYAKATSGHKSNRMYACIEQDGYSATFIYLPPQFSGPLALNSSVGYKFAEVPRITNDLKQKSLEVDKSSLIDMDICFADDMAQAAFAAA